jgi:hypothetical protein
MTLGDLFHSWSQWLAFSGGERSLWGHNVAWWGRVGKVLELFAGLAVLAEIIGAERLRAFGDATKHRLAVLTSRSFLEHLVLRPTWFGLRLVASIIGLTTTIAFLRFVLRKRWPRLDLRQRLEVLRSTRITSPRQVGSAATGFVLSPWFIVAGYGMAVLTTLIAPGGDPVDPQGTAVGSIAFGVIYAVLFLTATLAIWLGLLMLVLTPLLFLGYHAVIRPFAWALEQPHLEQHVKVLSVLLLVAGFHFDLLST